MLEHPEREGSERREGIEKIREFIEDFTERYRAEGIPIGLDGRIEMINYKDTYSDVDQDMARTREGQNYTEESRQRQMAFLGEQLEMLAYAILAKGLGERFVIARSSPHDDWSHGVDTILLDRQTGSLVCAFDEVGATSGPTYDKKRALIRQRNSDRGGAALKYGLGISFKDGKGSVIKDSADNLPVFYLALAEDRIKNGIANFLPHQEQRSDFEKNLFTYFIATLSAQVEELGLYSDQLNGSLKLRLAAFKKLISELNSSKDSKK